MKIITYICKKNQHIPNRLYNTQNHRPNKEGTMSMPAIAIAADSEPNPPPSRMIVEDSRARLIVNDVHTEDIDVAACDLALLNACPTQEDAYSGPNKKRQNGGNTFNDFDFGNFDCDVDDGVVDLKHQHHDGLLWVNTTMMIAGTAPSYTFDAKEALEILGTTLNETLVTTSIVATHDALCDPLSAAEARAMQILEKKKTVKFKGKSDMEMKRIRMNNVLSKGRTKTK
jgi:hypothetical protein